MGAVLALAILDVFITGTYKVFHGALTIGGLVAFSAYITRVFEHVGSAMDLYARTQSVGASIRSVRQLLTLEPTVQDTGTHRLPVGVLKCGFAIQDVCFSYADNSVLDHVSLKIQVGERIALIGVSGSGKSTLARLLVRTADPQSGKVRLENRRQTLILISHRIGSLAWVDRFVLLDSGRIVEIGSHEALYARSALYRSLFDASAHDASLPCN